MKYIGVLLYKMFQNINGFSICRGLFGCVFALLLIFHSSYVSAKEITLSWTPNEEVVKGYKIYSRSTNGVYDYDSPNVVVLSSTCSQESCTSSVSVSEDENTYFVVRAYLESGIESLDSNEALFELKQSGEEEETTQTDIVNGAVSGLSEALLASLTQYVGKDPSQFTDNNNLQPAVEIFNEAYEHKQWLYIMWNEYILAQGEMRVALGDIDGDGKDEIVIALGLDRDPAIPGGLFQIVDDDYSHMAWGRINWPEYNNANGEAYPVCGDIDGDGDDEILMGLGDAGQGLVEIIDYREGSLFHKDWAQVEWPEYNQLLGKTRPTCGDIDHDGKDEVIIGLGSDGSDPEMPAGLFQILDDDYSNLAWGEIDWPEYNEINGESFPSCANLNGNGEDMIVVGLGEGGQGRMEVFQYQDGMASHKDWITIDWEEYNQTVGETRPVCGDIDGDGRDEIVVGLSSNPDNSEIPSGVFPIIDNNYAHLAWSEIDWAEYNSGNGESFPAVGDTNADDKDELFIGLGVRSAFAAGEIGSRENLRTTGTDASGEDSGGGCFVSTSFKNIL